MPVVAIDEDPGECCASTVAAPLRDPLEPFATPVNEPLLPDVVAPEAFTGGLTVLPVEAGADAAEAGAVIMGAVIAGAGAVDVDPAAAA